MKKKPLSFIRCIHIRLSLLGIQRKKPYKTIVGLFLHGRNKDLCYINKDNTAYYFYDFNKVLIGNLIDWYKRVFDNFE